MVKPPAIPITGDDDADRLLEESPLALLLGMLLDQQIPMEWAFRGPATLAERLGGLDAARIAAMDQEEFVSVCVAKPAIHRYPASMGRRIHEVCQVLVDEYGGNAELIWTEAADARDLHKRLQALPGYGAEKTKVFIAILAKRFDIRAQGWEKVASPFSDDELRSAADVESEDSLLAIRARKKAMKAAGKSKAD